MYYISQCLLWFIVQTGIFLVFKVPISRSTVNAIHKEVQLESFLTALVTLRIVFDLTITQICCLHAVNSCFI